MFNEIVSYHRENDVVQYSIIMSNPWAVERLNNHTINVPLVQTIRRYFDLVLVLPAEDPEPPRVEEMQVLLMEDCKQDQIYVRSPRKLCVDATKPSNLRTSYHF